MRREFCFLLIVLVGLPSLACAQAAPTSPTSEPVLGYAYGHRVTGDPVFTTADDTLYVNGYAYYPRRGNPMAAPKAVSDAATRAHAITERANTAAASAVSTSDFVAKYTAVLDSYKGHGVVRYTASEGEIRTWFEGAPTELVTYVPSAFPVTPASPPDSVLAERETHFRTFHDMGAWICWGRNEGIYEVIVPVVWQEKSAAAIAQVRGFVRQGLTGPALDEAIGRVDVKNTPLQNKAFLRDIISTGRED